MANTEEEATVDIPIAKRGDTGKYNISVANDYGSDSGDLKVIVLGEWKLSRKNKLLCAEVAFLIIFPVPYGLFLFHLNKLLQ